MASPALGEGRVTRERYRQLVAEGVIGPDDRVELLEGVIVAMSPQNAPHAYAVAKLTTFLVRAAGEHGYVRAQSPLDVSESSTPEPDLALVQGPPELHASVHPTTALFVVEVADTSLIQDRLTKAAIYAAADIPEYWLVNLRDRCVEVHRHPIASERRYSDVRIVRPGANVDLLALPGASIGVAEVLPPG